MIKDDADAAERKGKGGTSTKTSDSGLRKGSATSPRSPSRSKSRPSPGSTSIDANERKVKQESDGGASAVSSPRRGGVPPSIDTSLGNNGPSTSGSKSAIMRQGSSEMSERSFLQAQTPKHCNKRASSSSGGKKSHGQMPQHPPSAGGHYHPHPPHQGQGPPPHYEDGYQGGPPPGGQPHHQQRPDNRYPRHPNDNGPPPPDGYYGGPPNSEQRPYPGPDGPPPHQGRYGPPPYYGRDDNNGPPPPHGPPPNKDGPPQSPRRGPPPPYGVGGPGGAFTPTDRKAGYGSQHPYYQQAGQQSSSIVVSPGNGPQPPGEYRGGPPPPSQQPPYPPHRGGGGYYQDGRGPREGDHPYNRPPHDGGYRGGYGGDRGYNQGPPPHGEGYRHEEDRYGGQDNRGHRDYPPQGPPPHYNNGPQGPPPSEEQGYRGGPPPNHDSRYPPRDGHPPSDRPPYPPSSEYHGGGWDQQRPPPRTQSDHPKSYHPSGHPSQRLRGSGEHEAAGFTRAVSSSFGETERSRPERHQREPDDDAASDSSWRQLKQVASVDEAQMQARIQRQEDDGGDRRKSKGGAKDREMSTTTPTPQDGVEELPHPTSNASSLSTSPSESREHPSVVDVRGAPEEVQYPQLPTPSKLMSLNSLSSVASVQEPMGTAEDTGSLSENVNMDLMQCNTGSGSLLFNSKTDNLDEDNPGANGPAVGSSSDSGSDKKRARESRGDGETLNEHEDGSDEIRRAPSDIKDPQTKSTESGQRPSKRRRHSSDGAEEEDKMSSSSKPSPDKKRQSQERPSTPPTKYKSSPLNIPSSPPFTPGGVIQIPNKGEGDSQQQHQGGRGHPPSKPSQNYHGHPPHHQPPHESNKTDRRGAPHRSGSFGSPTYYDKAPAYSYSLESLPSFSKDAGESGYNQFNRPGSSASGPINAAPVRVDGNEGGPPPRGQDYKDVVPSALSWDIQGQDSFGGAMTVASNGSGGGGGAHNLLSSFSFGNDYQMLAKSSSNVGASGPDDRSPIDRSVEGPPQSQQQDGGPPPYHRNGDGGPSHHPQHGGPPPPQGLPSQHHGGRPGPSMPESRNQSFEQSRTQSFESGHYSGSQRSRAESYDPYGGPPPHYQGNGPPPSGPEGYKSSGQRSGPPPSHSSHQSPPQNSQSFPPHASSWGTSTSHQSSYSSSSGRHQGHLHQPYTGNGGGPGNGGPPPDMPPRGGDHYDQYRGGGRPHSPPSQGGPPSGPPPHHQGGPPPQHRRGPYPPGPDGMMRNYSADGSRMGASSPPPPLHHRGGHNSWGAPPPHDRHHPGWGPGPDHHRGEPYNLPNAFQPPPPEFSNMPPHMGGKRPPPTVYIVSSNPNARMRGPHGDPSLMSKSGIGNSGVYGWSKDDDAWLTEIMKKYKNPRDWEPIAKQHGRGKTAKECHERWIRYLKPGVRKGQWQDHEDAIVVEAVSTSTEQPFTRWSDLAQRLPGRVGKQIRDRWVNHLNPAINHMPFSREDDLLLWEGHKKLGKRWVEISTKYFNSTRSENHIKNRWYSASFKKFIANEFGPDAYAGKAADAGKKDKDKNKEKSSEDSDAKKPAVKSEV